MVNVRGLPASPLTNIIRPIMGAEEFLSLYTFSIRMEEMEKKPVPSPTVEKKPIQLLQGPDKSLEGSISSPERVMPEPQAFEPPIDMKFPLRREKQDDVEEHSPSRGPGPGGFLTPAWETRRRQ